MIRSLHELIEQLPKLPELNLFSLLEVEPETEVNINYSAHLISSVQFQSNNQCYDCVLLQFDLLMTNKVVHTYKNAFI